MLNTAITFNRFTAMKVVANILNEQIDRDYERYKIFVILQKNQLESICESLNDDSEFNDKIKALLKTK